MVLAIKAELDDDVVFVVKKESIDFFKWCAYTRTCKFNNVNFNHHSRFACVLSFYARKKGIFREFIVFNLLIYIKKIRKKLKKKKKWK